MLNGVPECHQRRKLHGAVRVLHILQLKWTCALLSHANLYNIQRPVLLYMIAGYLRLALHCKPPEMLEQGAILLQDNSAPHHHCDVQILAQCWDWEVVAHPSYSPDLALYDYQLFECVKGHLQSKQFELRDSINTAVTTSSHRMNTNTELQLIIYHIYGKCVWTVLVNTLSGGHLFKHLGMSVVLFSCVLLLQ